MDARLGKEKLIRFYLLSPSRVAPDLNWGGTGETVRINGVILILNLGKLTKDHNHFHCVQSDLAMPPETLAAL